MKETNQMKFSALLNCPRDITAKPKADKERRDAQCHRSKGWSSHGHIKIVVDESGVSTLQVTGFLKAPKTLKPEDNIHIAMVVGS